MSGYPYNANQQFPTANQIYPQIYNPANAPAPGQQQNGFPAPQQHPQYGFQPGFAPYPGQPGAGYPGQPAAGYQGQPAGYAGYPGQPANISQGQPGHPAAMSYPGAGIAPSAPMAPGVVPYYPGQPQVTPQGPIEWIPTTPKDAHTLTHRAVVAGYEGYDKSPLWVMRARFESDFIPGKLAIKHQSAYVAWGGNENQVHNIEVCCAPPERVRWVESSNGQVPPNAVIGGNTADGEPLYVGRAKEQGSLTPGKVHPSHGSFYLSFAGKEVAHKSYEVLCTV